jgi:GTP-binding protein Era
LPIANQLHSGYITLVGRPNVGKSTLLNRILGHPVAIVSPKPQTTRDRILGIRTEEKTQMIFLDTPGIHKAKGILNRIMVKQALGAIEDADILIPLFAANEKIHEEEHFLMERVRESGIPYIAALNKIDRLKPEDLLVVWNSFLPLTEGALERIAISAKTNAGVDALVDLLRANMPVGPFFFPPDMLTDRDETFQIAEMIREQILRMTNQEVPYAVAIVIRTIHERESDGLIMIEAGILVEQESQKPILIGKGGSKLKQIGTAARERIERFLHKKVFLNLQVEVRKDWRSKPKELRQLGFSEES